MTPSDRSEAIRRAQDGALKAAMEGRWDHARAFLEYREEILKMDQSHLSAADSSAASGSVERDAARYRWLEGHAGEVNAAFGLCWDSTSDTFNDPRDAASLDAAVDAAMKRGQK